MKLTFYQNSETQLMKITAPINDYKMESKIIVPSSEKHIVFIFKCPHSFQILNTKLNFIFETTESVFEKKNLFQIADCHSLGDVLHKCYTVLRFEK